MRIAIRANIVHVVVAAKLNVVAAVRNAKHGGTHRGSSGTGSRLYTSPMFMGSSGLGELMLDATAADAAVIALRPAPSAPVAHGEAEQPRAMSLGQSRWQRLRLNQLQRAQCVLAGCAFGLAG